MHKIVIVLMNTNGLTVQPCEMPDFWDCFAEVIPWLATQKFQWRIMSQITSKQKS